MISLLKEVGRGKRGARDLTYDEATQAADMILNGSATPVQIGAFLVAERIKMESIDEILAFIHACRRHSETFSIPNGLDCAGPYDGRTRSFIASFPTAFVLAACGVPVTLHGSPSLPPKMGVTLTDLVSELNVPISAIPRQAFIDASIASGFLFIATEDWCPPLSSLRSYRQQLGLRTVFNSAEKLLRLSDARYMVSGVFHGTVFEKTAKLISELGVERGMIIQGMEGSEDLSIEKRTRTYFVENGASELYVVDPEAYELQVEVAEMDWTVQLQAHHALEVLHGRAELPFLNSVLLNAAVRLWISQKVTSIEEGIYLARHMIDNGSALRQYNTWRLSINQQQQSQY